MAGFVYCFCILNVIKYHRTMLLNSPRDKDAICYFLYSLQRVKLNAESWTDYRRSYSKFVYTLNFVTNSSVAISI